MFDPLNESLDIEWLQANGWTVAGNLAYRHILYEFNHSGIPSQERIEQIIMQYDAADQGERIRQALQELIQLKKDIHGLVDEEN